MRKSVPDQTELVLGIWLFISPWILGYSGQGAPAANAYVVGIAITAFALVALYTSVRWPYQERFNYFVLGLWLLASPWLLGFSALGAATWNAVIVALLVMGAAAWALAVEQSPDSKQVSR